MQYLKVTEAQAELEKALLKLPGVVGVGVGYKNVKGKDTQELSVKVFVVEKKTKKSLTKSDIIPPTHTLNDGTLVKLDVVEAGNIQFTGAYFGRYRPAQPGAILGHVNSQYDGTFGALVTDNLDGKKVILSASHSLANFNNAATGDVILQPGTTAGGKGLSDRIGTLKRFVPLNLGNEGVNYVDAGLAAPDDTGSVKNTPFCSSINLKKQGAVGLLYAGSPSITIVNPIAAVISELNITFPKIKTATPGMSIHKCGAATGYTATTVSSIGTTIGMTLENGNRIEWRNQIITAGGISDAAAGDSGAIFYTTFNV